MKTIRVHPDSVALVDDEDFERLSSRQWRIQRGYAAHGSVFMHREIMPACPGFVADHVNGDKLDNRKFNLRLVTQAQNRWNSRGYGLTGFKGVTYMAAMRTLPWRATITVRGTKLQLGFFASAIEAATAYDCSALRYFGEHAAVNGVDPEIRASAKRALVPESWSANDTEPAPGFSPPQVVRRGVGHPTTLSAAQEQSITDALREGFGVRKTARRFHASWGQVLWIKRKLGLVKPTGPVFRRDVPCPGCGGQRGAGQLLCCACGRRKWRNGACVCGRPRYRTRQCVCGGRVT